MRLRRESLLLLGVFTAVCALAGIVVGIATGALIESPTTVPPTSSLTTIQPAARPTSAATPILVTPSTPGQQWALLIIGVDDLNSPNPRLEGCWVLTYRSGDVNYYGLSFPPNANYTISGLEGEHTLAQVFEADRAQQRGYAFLRDAIQSRFPAFNFDADVLLDRGDFAGLVAELGGLNVAGQLLSGADLLGTYDAYAPNDITGRLNYQQQVFAALFSALAQQGWTAAQVTDYLKQLPQLQNDPTRANALDAYAADAPDFDEAALNWTTLPP